MSFRRYWLARVKESFAKGRVISEAAGFMLLLISGLVTRDVPRFSLGQVIWWILFGGFVAALVIEICLISPANEAARLIKERDQAQKELERIRDYQIARRRRARDTCLEHCVEIYANTRPALMIGALWRAQGHKLATNEDLVWVCEQLETRGHCNPFANSSIPTENWLEFLHDARLAGRDLAKDAEAAIDAFREWRLTGRLKPALL